VDRRGGGDRLEGGPRRIDLAERARERGVVRRGVQQVEVGLHHLRVVARQWRRIEAGVGVHRDDLARRGLDHDHRALLRAEQVLRLLLRVDPEAGDQVPHALLALEEVDDVLETDRRPTLAEQHVVVRGLEAGVPDRDRLVPDDLGHEILERVLPLLAVLVLHVGRSGQDRALGADDLAARRVELLEDVPRVVAVVGELLRVDHLQPRELADEDEHEHDHAVGDAPDPDVHAWADSIACRRAASSTMRSSSAALSSEMRNSNARMTKLAINDDPPYETNGSVTPVSGITRVMPPMITKVCTPRLVARPAANSWVNGREAWIAMRNALPTSSMNAPITATVPISPSSSPMAAKMKSVLCTGIWNGIPRPIPLPVKPPLPNANRLCVIW